MSRFLSENNVNHYDIKCDNYLIEPYDRDMTKEDLYSQPSMVPNFSVCLADFGESLLYTADDSGYTTDNRGTEFIKSPEMLTVAYASQVTKDTFDRRKKVGAGRASDIWSLGCLFFELLTNDFLFYDSDWVRFFIRVTSDPELITEEKEVPLTLTPTLSLQVFLFAFFPLPPLRAPPLPSYTTYSLPPPSLLTPASPSLWRCRQL